MEPIIEKISQHTGFALEDPWIGGILWMFLPPNAGYDPVEHIDSTATGANSLSSLLRSRFVVWQIRDYLRK